MAGNNSEHLEFLWDEPCEGGDGGYLAEKLNALADALPVQKSKGPITIAIYGPWGAGKTSALKQFERSLKSRDAVTVWFETWRYEREEDLMIPLLTEMIAGVAELPRIEKTKQSLLDTGYRVLGRVAKAGARAAAGFVAEKVGVDAKDLEQIGKDFMECYEGVDKEFRYSKSETQAFTDDFKKLIRIAATGRLNGKLSDWDAKPVCVLIDDLDRCHPEKVKSLLESMKNLLWVPGVTYAVALDRDQVTTAIAEPFVKMFPAHETQAFAMGKERAKAYLEKFFLYTLDIGDHASGFHNNVVRPMKEKMFTCLTKTLEDECKGNDWDIITKIFELTDDNPRRIKRVLRWLYLTVKTENQTTVGSYALETRFADLVFSESFPLIWLELFADEGFSVRNNYYIRLTEALAKVINDDDSVDEDEAQALAAKLISSKSTNQTDIVFQGTRTGDYLAFIMRKRDVKTIKRLFGLAIMAASGR